MSTSGMDPRKPARSSADHPVGRAARRDHARIRRTEILRAALGSEMRTAAPRGMSRPGRDRKRQFAPVIRHVAAMPNIERQSPRIRRELQREVHVVQGSTSRTSAHRRAGANNTVPRALDNRAHHAGAEHPARLDAAKLSLADLQARQLRPPRTAWDLAATFGAPHTMVSVSPVPASTGHAKLVRVRGAAPRSSRAPHDAGELGRERRDLLDLGHPW